MPVRLEVISGATSWGYPSGVIKIGTYHVAASASHLSAVVAHEFGHVIAFRYGTDAYGGAAPAGWPYSGREPAEAWADCVAEVFTGIIDPSHGLGPCPAATRAWTASWLAAGPG